MPLDKAAPEDVVERLASDPSVDETGLEAEAKRLETQARKIRELAGDVHRARTQAELKQVIDKPDGEIDLLRAALLIAKLDNRDVDVDAYVQDAAKLARRISASLPENADDAARLAALNRVLFEEQGYHGSRTDYSNPSNSYLNEVLDDREGLPITLSVLYMELGRRIGLKIEGVGLPGHFVTRFVPKDGEPKLIDVFEQGRTMSLDEAKAKVLALNGSPWREEFLAAQPPKAILARMLRNLFGLARDARRAEEMYRYADTMLILEPESGNDRFVRAVLAYQTDRLPQAQRDVQWLLERRPEEVDVTIVEDLARAIARAQGKGK
jgi:regulator of sirC expression with transglutaminase-like and TPR domain